MTRLRNGVGVSISNIPTLSSKRRATAFTPLSLFADGSQGVWYDDSLTSSMYQDSAGTTAAALESPVGLQLDLSQNLALGSELVTNGTFTTDVNGWFANATNSTIAWDAGTLKLTRTSTSVATAYTTLSGLTVGARYTVQGSVTAFSGSIGLLYFSSSTSSTNPLAAGFTTSSTTVATGSKNFYFVASATTMYLHLVIDNNGPGGTANIDNVSVKSIAGNARYQATSANRPTLSARYNLLTATATLATQSITTVATSYTIYFTGSGTVTLSGTYVGVFSAGTNTFTATAGTLTATVAGSVLTADIRPTNQTVTLPAYQAVTSSTVYDTVGFPQYLKYNGSNSSLSTASINFTATAQMSAFSGARKLADNSAATLMELSADASANNGAFYLQSNTSNFTVLARGTGYGYYQPSITAAPYTAVYAALINTLGATLPVQIIPRINGVVSQTAGTGSTGGTGNFGTYPLYFGSGGGTRWFFNGQEYQTIIVGKTLTATEISNTETYVNSKTKAY